ncbi:MAG: DUF1549 and DUF1553 domain-containing protein [Planctomycetaceae bacterium]
MPPAADRRSVSRTPLFRHLWGWLTLVGILGPVTPSSHAESPEAADSSVYGIQIESFHRDHWSFRPVQPAVIPTCRDGQSPNAIDRFVAAALETRGLPFAPTADDEVWLRRVWLDLVVRPPTASALQDFRNDLSGLRRERAVDRLLADPGYGLRWGRRWLDVARYAETNGYERDGAKPNAWRYRDWVIDSLNRDKPFDQFLTEQLAGDELPQVTAETLIATTFLRLGTWDDEPADPLVDRYDQLDDVVGTVSTAFLGMTLRCARCHNHKFEPLSQIDYGRMLAIFDPLERPRRDRTEFDVEVGTPQELADHRAAVARQQAALQTVQQQAEQLAAQVRNRYFAGAPRRLTAEAFAAHQLPADQRSAEQKKLAETTAGDLAVDLKDLETTDERRQREGFDRAREALQQTAPDPLPRAYIFRETPAPWKPTQVFRRGNPQTPAGTVSPGFPEVLSQLAIPVAFSTGSPPDAPREAGMPIATSGRRLALAKWMTNPRNPLVARVSVNRIWQGHFGDGLVSTENDFGVMGTPPSHPELLDWLAQFLIDSGWSLKNLHRQIVLSQVYGQSSTAHAEGLAADPDNRLLWRYPYRRLEAEVLRDCVLQASGQLNHEMGGPSVYPRIHRAVLEGQSRPGEGWGTSSPAQMFRRSAFVYVKRSLLVPELELLDLPDTTSSCEQRVVSTIPTQALTLINGEFFNSQAAFLADRLARRVPSSTAGEQTDVNPLREAHRLVLGRMPETEELEAGQRFLIRQRELLHAEGVTNNLVNQRAWSAWCLVLLNLNEFTYLD